MSDDAPLASLELRLSESDRRGRVFVPVDRLRSLNADELKDAFNRNFIEGHEIARFDLLRRALARPSVTVETYPGETPPQEMHIYLLASGVSDDPIFACILAPPAVVRELASRPPYVVMETASFQVMDSDVTNAAVTAAVEAWVQRLWPAIRVPTLRLSPWPGPIETEEGAFEFLRQFPETRALPAEASADATFSPPADLVAREFLLPEQAA